MSRVVVPLASAKTRSSIARNDAARPPLRLPCPHPPRPAVAPRARAGEGLALRSAHTDGCELPPCLFWSLSRGNQDPGDAAQINDLRKQLGDVEARVRAAMVSDIRDGALVVPADSTVSSQRHAFAFDVDPDRLILLGTEKDAAGDRTMLCGLVADDPAASIAMDSDLFHDILFQSKVTKKDVDAINRRNLLREDANAKTHIHRPPQRTRQRRHR
eukprot:COSAG06_NODE_3082_length_5885_cov_4.044245_8_plen_214_part_01